MRQDTTFRHFYVVEEELVKAEEKLSALSPSPTKDRKFEFVGDGDEAACPLDGTTFTIIDLDAVNNALLAFSKCRA